MSSFRRRAALAFDAWAPTYEADVVDMLERRGYSYKKLADTIAAEVSLDRSSNVLEVGVGPGTLGSEVYNVASHVEIVGLDLSTRMLELAYDRGIYKLLSRGSAERLPFPSSCFDALYCAFVMHSVLDQTRAFREICRVLKPGGMACLVDLCPIGRPKWLANFAGMLHSILREYGALALYQPVEQYVRFALDVGLTVTHVRPLGNKKRYRHFLLTLRREYA